MNELKWQFLNDAFLTGAINDALRRSSTYSEEAKPDSELRKHLRRELKSALSEMSRRYQDAVAEQQHVANIHELKKRISDDCKSALKGGELRFGVAQKALNVYLKYLWCAAAIPIPPHCTFDDRIINRQLKKYLPAKCCTAWTTTDDPQDYDSWLAAAKTVAKVEPLAAWELRVYPETYDS